MHGVDAAVRQAAGLGRLVVERGRCRRRRASAEASVPAPHSASRAATRARPCGVTANTATRAASPTSASALGSPVTSLPFALHGQLALGEGGRRVTPHLPAGHEGERGAGRAEEQRERERATGGADARPPQRRCGLPWSARLATSPTSARRSGTDSHPPTLPPRRSRRVRTALSTAAALLRHSVSSAAGVGVGDDTGAGLHVGRAVAQQRGADGDGGVGVPGEVEIADAAAVERRGGWAPAPR